MSQQPQQVTIERRGCLESALLSLGKTVLVLVILIMCVAMIYWGTKDVMLKKQTQATEQADP